MNKLIEELKELEELIMRCMRCGACQSVCPLYQKDLQEQSVARSKLALIESVYQGRLNDAGKILKYIDYCILCGRCKANCPSGVKIDEIFLRARSVLRKIQKMPGWQKAILKIAMDKPQMLSRIAPLMHIGLKFGAKKVKDDIFKPIIKAYSDRHFLSIKGKPFTVKYGGFNKSNNEKLKVIFYPGCAVNFMLTTIGEAIVETLMHYGVSVHVPDINKCCGIPAASMGELDLYKQMVNLNFDYFASIDAEYVITCCPTCEYGFKDLGVRITKRDIPLKTMDILVFMDEILNIDNISAIKDKMSLHMPCHYDSSKANVPGAFIAKHIKGNYITLENQDCCGFGGTFNLKHYKDSKQISMSKIEEIKAKGIKRLFTPCPGCIMQLTDAVVTEGIETTVTHPVEMIYREINRTKIKE